MRLAACIAMVVAAGCGATTTCPVQPRPEAARPFLWEVTSASGTIYLFGTHHAAAGEDVPPEAKRLLAGADLFVAEVPEVDATYDEDPAWRARLELPAGRSLDEEMSRRDFDRLDWRLGIPRSRLERLRPWVALNLLIKSVFTFPDPNMPSALFAQARAQDTPMEFLDTLAQQRVFLDMMIGSRDLTAALHAPDLECSVMGEVARYHTGDEAAFATRGAAAEASAPGTTTMKSSAITERDRVWTQKIATHARSGRRVFVGIGVANIVGPRGIAARLTELGFDVKRL